MILNIALWAIQIIIGLMLLFSGAMKVFSYEKVKATLPLSRGLVAFIGISELLGGLGLTLPYATGIAPVLTPVAAIGVSVIMVLAAGYHLRRKEYPGVAITIVYLALSLFVAIGRWE